MRQINSLFSQAPTHPWKFSNYLDTQNHFAQITKYGHFLSSNRTLSKLYFLKCFLTLGEVPVWINYGSEDEIISILVDPIRKFYFKHFNHQIICLLVFVRTRQKAGRQKLEIVFLQNVCVCCKKNFFCLSVCITFAKLYSCFNFVCKLFYKIVMLNKNFYFFV